MPGNGRVQGLVLLAYALRYSADTAEIIPSDTISAGMMPSTIFSRGKPIYFAISLLSLVGRPEAIKASLKQSQTSSMVSSKVPSQSKITSRFITSMPPQPKL